MRHFIFCHGFGFNRNFWKNLAPIFSKEKCTYLDLGYFGKDCDFNIESGDNILIGIAHSLGLLKLLMLNKEFDYLIGLNSFINFLGYDPAVRKQREREIATLEKHFTKSPIKTLKSFYRRCGVSLPSKEIVKINATNLLGDLNLLKINFNISSTVNLLIIGATDDSIVPPIILYDNFDQHPNVSIELMDQGKHGLGFFKAHSVSTRIMKFISNDN